MSPQSPPLLAQRGSPELALAILLATGDMCPACEWATRRRVAEVGALPEKCGKRVERKKLPKIGRRP